MCRLLYLFVRKKLTIWNFKKIVLVLCNVTKKKLRIWYRLWENSNRITYEEEKWAQDIFSKEIDEYDVTFITTDEFLDYLNKSPEAKKDLTKSNSQFDFVELIDC